MGATNIQWCDFTFNGWEGCSKVSPGCKNCYAETRNHRFGGNNWGSGKPRRRTSAANWWQPLKWNQQAAMAAGSYQSNPLQARFDNQAPRRPRVFCASLADWLDDEVPIEWLADLLKLIHDTPNLDWLLLTKRVELWKSRMIAVRHWGDQPKAEYSNNGTGAGVASCWLAGKAPANVWFGVSVEDQQHTGERIPLLFQIPARIRFLSVEPILGPIDFGKASPFCDEPAKNRDGHVVDPTYGQHDHPFWTPGRKTEIDWVIFGGESGPGARPCDINWIRDGVQQCRAASVAPFVKQLGSNAVCDNANPVDWPNKRWPFRDKKGGDPDEWPADLRVREFPKCIH